MRITPDFGAVVLREFNRCHEPAGRPEGGRFARRGSGNCDPGGEGRPGQTMAGVTTYRKPEQYAEDPRGTTTGQTTYDAGAVLAQTIGQLPEVRDVQYARARGSWSFDGELGREPSFGLTYTGNGEARRTLAETGLNANQDAVLMMYSAAGPLPEGAQAQPSEVHELAIPGGVSPRVRAVIEDTISRVLPTSGWTWIKQGDRHTLRMARVPQWADESASAEAYAQAVATVRDVMTAAGMSPMYRRQDVRIETLVHERTLDWFPRERGNVVYQDVLQPAFAGVP